MLRKIQNSSEQTSVAQKTHEPNKSKCAYVKVCYSYCPRYCEKLESDMLGWLMKQKVISNVLLLKIIPQLYQDVLGRAPDSAGFEYWNKQFMADGVLDENERKTFEEAARAELLQREQ